MLGEARVSLEVLTRADRDDSVVVLELGSRAVGAVARHDLLLGDVDRLDLAHVHLRRREDAPGRIEDVAGQDAAGHHLADQRVEREVVVSVDNGDGDFSALDLPAELLDRRLRDKTSAQDQYMWRRRHGRRLPQARSQGRAAEIRASDASVAATPSSM